MLRKLQVATLVGAVLTVVRLFIPDLEVPEGFEKAVEELIIAAIPVVMIVVAWWTREDPKQAAKLELRKGRLP